MQNASHESFSHAASRLARDPRALTPLVLAMGFIGATLRYVLELAVPAHTGFPGATLTINIFGCFTLEIVNQYVGRYMNLPAPVVKSLGVGLIGAFTTLSAFSTESLEFLMEGRFGMFTLYFAITIVTTFLASLAGHFAVRAMARRRTGKGSER